MFLVFDPDEYLNDMDLCYQLCMAIQLAGLAILHGKNFHDGHYTQTY